MDLVQLFFNTFAKPLKKSPNRQLNVPFPRFPSMVMEEALGPVIYVHLLGHFLMKNQLGVSTFQDIPQPNDSTITLYMHHQIVHPYQPDQPVDNQVITEEVNEENDADAILSVQSPL